jgi:hypothetical protein
MSDGPIRVITVRDSSGGELTVLRQYPDGIYAESWDQPVKLTRDQLAELRTMLDDAAKIAPSPLGPGLITPAHLETWKDPDATITILAPDQTPDPAEQHCMYHRQLDGVPIAVHITTRWPMVSTACQPCGESILAYLHGAPWTQIAFPDAVLQAGEISMWMAKITATARTTRP